eukprot:755360-Hanusia_phi.AAC.2
MMIGPRRAPGPGELGLELRKRPWVLRRAGAGPRPPDRHDWHAGIPCPLAEALAGVSSSDTRNFGLRGSESQRRHCTRPGGDRGVAHCLTDRERRPRRLPGDRNVPGSTAVSGGPGVLRVRSRAGPARGPARAARPRGPVGPGRPYSEYGGPSDDPG